MPVPRTKKSVKLRLPQIRVLAVLCASRPDPLLSRGALAERCGFSPLSGTVTRVLNGVREGSSSGSARPGLVPIGYVSKTDLDIDGVIETVYQITPQGRQAYEDWIEEHGELPPMRGADISTNKRYQKEDDDE